MGSPLQLPKRRGRPPKDAHKRLEWEKANSGIIPIKKTKHETPEQILKRIEERFDILHRMAIGATEGKVRSFIASGAPGIGKSFTLEEVLDKAKSTANFTLRPIQSEIVRGVLTPINLFKLLYRNKAKNAIVVLDDADGIFSNEDSLNLLKAATDTNSKRYISWLSESAALADENIPTQFLYEGVIVFLTNLDFQAFLDVGKNRLTPHLEALMSRSFYLDLGLHGREELTLWIGHQTRKRRILQREGLTDEQSETALKWILGQPDQFRELSLRTALKVATLMRMEPTEWQTMAKALMIK